MIDVGPRFHSPISTALAIGPLVKIWTWNFYINNEFGLFFYSAQSLNHLFRRTVLVVELVSY